MSGIKNTGLIEAHPPGRNSAKPCIRKPEVCFYEAGIFNAGRVQW
jgi:hypothetical protein